MGSITDEIVNEHDRYGKPRCFLAAALSEMEPEEQEEFISALRNPAFYSKVISDVLKRHGYPVSEWSIRRCRKECHCQFNIRDTQGE